MWNDKLCRNILATMKKTCCCVEIQNGTCLVHEIKHNCKTAKKKRLSKINNKSVCWLTLSFTCILFIFFLNCKAHVVVEWGCVLINEYSPCLIHFLAFFLCTWLLLIISSLSSCSQLLHAGEFLELSINSSLLQQLANNVQRCCSLREQIYCLLENFFTIEIIGLPPCPRGPVQLTVPRVIFLNFVCIFHKYC